MQIIRFIGEDENIHFGTNYQDGRATLITGDIYSDFNISGQTAKVKSLLSPVNPVAIICIGLNYRLHAKETGMELPKNPVVFMKNPGAVTAHEERIEIPKSCIDPAQVDYEAELAVVIGKKAKNVKEEKAFDYILGYTCANDISARRWQKHAGAMQWIKGKSFDTFCPLGPWLVTADEIKNPQSLDIECRINGQTMQQSNTNDMIFSVAQIIAYLSQSATLLPGTVILTGTPSGVGFTREPPVFLQEGDLLETQIESIGLMKNKVINEK